MMIKYFLSFILPISVWRTLLLRLLFSKAALRMGFMCFRHLLRLLKPIPVVVLLFLNGMLASVIYPWLLLSTLSLKPLCQLLLHPMPLFVLSVVKPSYTVFLITADHPPLLLHFNFCSPMSRVLLQYFFIVVFIITFHLLMIPASFYGFFLLNVNRM